jgi:hypothetical protein
MWIIFETADSACEIWGLDGGDWKLTSSDMLRLQSVNGYRRFGGTYCFLRFFLLLLLLLPLPLSSSSYLGGMKVEESHRRHVCNCWLINIIWETISIVTVWSSGFWHRSALLTCTDLSLCRLSCYTSRRGLQRKRSIRPKGRDKDEETELGQ